MRATPDQWAEFTVQALHWTGVLKVEVAEWLAPIVSDGEGRGLASHDIAKSIMQHGTQAPEAEVAALGIHKRFPVGSGYIDALTALGRTKAERAAELVAHRALGNFYRWRTFEQTPKLFNEVRIVTVGDRRTCGAGLALNGQLFPRGTEPFFPLPECDAEMCCCAYQMRSPRLRERIARRTQA
jgi:hypothetical protein